MIELYNSPSPNVQKIHIMLEELGVPYQTRAFNIWKGDQFTPEFVKLNPNSKVPVIVDKDGPEGKPYAVFESGAILIYLAEKYGKFLPASGKARADVMQWLMIQMAGIGPMCGQLNHFMRHASDQTYSVSRYATESARLYQVLDKRLAEAPYLGGDDYSIADIATYPWIRVEERILGDKYPFLRTDDPAHPHLNDWYRRISERPAIPRAMETIARFPSTEPTATPEDKDRLMGRGKYAHESVRG